MIIILSPAKTLDMTPIEGVVTTQPALKSQANQLAKVLKEKDVSDLKSLMSISDKLAVENVHRFQSFKQRTNPTHGKPALFTFNGDVYRGLGAEDYGKRDVTYAQEHLRILSGLYGVLRPLDAMQPYRLEMGTKLKTDKGNNLYEFWGNKVTKEINKAFKPRHPRVLINLASEEYSKVIKRDKLDADELILNFKEWKDDKLRFVSFTAKVARGLMARYIIKNRIRNLEDIKGFDLDGYGFSAEHSDDKTWIFVR